jgi:hypothetical protein
VFFGVFCDFLEDFFFLGFPCLFSCLWRVFCLFGGIFEIWRVYRVFGGIF